MALLRAVEVGYPERQPVPVQHFGYYVRSAAAADDVDHRLVV